jgi:gliding motility-associated-like protein
VTTVQVDVVEGPNSGVAEPAAALCNTPGNFDLNTLLDGSQDGGGEWTQASGTTALTVDINTGDVSFSGAAADTYTFDYTLTSSAPCVDAVTTVTVNLDEDANAGTYIGTPGEVCNSEDAYNLKDLLTGNPTDGGTWISLDGITVNGDLADFTGIGAGSYIFTYDVDNACGDDDEDVTVNVTEGPNSGVAEPAAELCNSTTSFDLFSLLDGSQDGGGEWTQASGITTLTVDINTGDVDFSGATTDTYTFNYTVSGNNPCVDAVTTVTVNVIEPLSAGIFNAAPSANLTSINSPFDLFTLLDDEDAGGSWSITSGTGASIADPLVGEVDFSGAATATYEFTYTVTTTAGVCNGSSDSETVIIDFLNFQCEDTKFSFITEDATCSGVQDGLVFMFLQNVSNAANLQAVINGTDTLTFANPGNGGLVELDTTFFSGNYDITLYDPLTDCDSTKSILIGQKQSIIPLVNTTDATCDNPVGQIQVTIDGTFDFVLLDSADNQIGSPNSTGLFTDLAPATYGIAFTNSGGCQVDTVKNIIINEPTQVSNSALDLTVVEPSCNTTRAQILVNFELEGAYFYQILDTADVVVDSITTDLGEWTTELNTLGLFELVVTNVDNPGLCEPNSRNFNIERSGGFTATVTDKTDVVCFGESTGSVTIELDGISNGFYSLDGNLWTRFISGNTINGLPADINLLISDTSSTSGCSFSLETGITQPKEAFELNGEILTETPASCTASETTGVIFVPEVLGGVEPFKYLIDGNEVQLTGDRFITELSRTAQNLIIEDATGCTISTNISSIVSPNEIRVNQVIQLNPDDVCFEDPAGIQFVLSQETISSIPGPYLLTLNKVNDTLTSEIVLNINNGDNEFTIPQFNPNSNIPFERGMRYSWSIRSVDDEQVCPAVSNELISISGGAVVPSFDLNLVDVACFNSNGFLEITNIVANNDFPLFIQVSKNGEIVEPIPYNDFELNDSFVISTFDLGEPDGGTYNVILYQEPEDCNAIIRSEELGGIIEEPTAELRAELVPEPNLPPNVDRSRNDMNPVPATRETTTDGSISIRLTSTTGSPNGLYYADLNLVEPLGSNSRGDYAALLVDSVLFGADEVITFNGLLPGVYEITFYDEFGCNQNNKIIGQEGNFQITVDYDRSPFIPNVFTPNNDGKNDSFRILNLPDNGAELIVTNRTGKIVYRDSNYRASNLWDGGDNPDGIYFYQLTVDGSVQTGWVEILRGRR